MRIYFHCRRCRRALSDLAAQSGKPVICPGCKAEIIVPSGSEMGPPALEQRPPRLARVAAVIAEIPTVTIPNTIPKPAAIMPTASTPTAMSAKPKSANQLPASGHPTQTPNTSKAWLYRMGAVAGVLVLLGAVGAITSRMWSPEKDTPTFNQPAEEEEDQIAGLDQTAIPPAPECCNDCEPASENKSPGDKPELSVVAKLDVQKNGNNLDNNLASPQKPAAKREVAEKSNTESPLVAKRRQTKAEEELRKDLAWVKEIGLGATASEVLRNWSNWINAYTYGAGGHDLKSINLRQAAPIFTSRPDLAGLPFRQGMSCQLNAKEAKVLGELSRKLRLYLNLAAPLDVEGHRPKSPMLLRETLRLEMRGKRPEWLRYEAIPAMTQILMPEDSTLRLMLVDMLAAIPEKQATVALAQRAIFDFSPEVREAALAALKKRTPDDYRPVLLKGLRYPLAPVADQAAEALVVLNGHDNQTIARLVIMLDEPNPVDPQIVRNQGGFQRELVKVKHMTNCLLCHPPSATGKDAVMGSDPTPDTASLGGIAFRTFFPGMPYYNPNGSVSSGSIAIRGDITFLRQDFSVMQPELQAGTTLPSQMRYDYFVRVRWIPEKRARELRTKLDEQATYPQHESVLFALRELTGQDAGPTTEAWQKLFPCAELDVEAANFRDELVNASAKKRENILSALKDGEGVVYTVALADAIRKLPQDFGDKARQALAERLSRMTPETLRDKFADDDVEIRKAAIQACVMKSDASLVSDLSELLEDPSPAVAGLAGDAIKVLSKSKQKQKSSQATEVSSTKN